MDITQLILDDHHEQRRLFAILEDVDRHDIEKLGTVWARLTAHMSAHVEGEEQHFYPALLRLGKIARVDTVEETDDAIENQNEIRDAIEAVAREQVGGDAWFRAVAKVNKANSEHMGEEEREGLTHFRRHATLQQRHEIGLAFAAFEASHIVGVPTTDKDPKSYIAAHASG